MFALSSSLVSVLSFVSVVCEVVEVVAALVRLAAAGIWFVGSLVFWSVVGLVELYLESRQTMGSWDSGVEVESEAVWAELEGAVEEEEDLAAFAQYWFEGERSEQFWEEVEAGQAVVEVEVEEEVELLEEVGQEGYGEVEQSEEFAAELSAEEWAQWMARAEYAFSQQGQWAASMTLGGEEIALPELILA